MPFATNPDTLAIGQAIVTYLQNLTYPNTSTTVYTQASLEAIKDVVDLVANGGVCCEVYGDLDVSERRGFGGRVWDTQTWYALSLCALDTATHAQQIYPVRDALVMPFQQHATLSLYALRAFGSTVDMSVPNLFQSQLKPNGKFFRVQRSGQWLRAYLAELETKQEWVIQGGVVS